MVFGAFYKIKKSFVQYPISAMESRTLPPNHKRQARSDLRGASLEQTQKGFNPFFNYTHTSQQRERKRNTLGCSGATSVKYSFNTTSRSRQVPADTSGYDTDNGTGTDADGTGPYCTTSEIRTNEGRTTYRTRTTLDSVRKDLKRFLWFLLVWNGQNWV